MAAVLDHPRRRPPAAVIQLFAGRLVRPGRLPVVFGGLRHTLTTQAVAQLDVFVLCLLVEVTGLSCVPFTGGCLGPAGGVGGAGQPLSYPSRPPGGGLRRLLGRFQCLPRGFVGIGRRLPQLAAIATWIHATALPGRAKYVGHVSGAIQITQPLGCLVMQLGRLSMAIAGGAGYAGGHLVVQVAGLLMQISGCSGVAIFHRTVRSHGGLCGQVENLGGGVGFHVLQGQRRLRAGVTASLLHKPSCIVATMARFNHGGPVHLLRLLYLTSQLLPLRGVSAEHPEGSI